MQSEWKTTMKRLFVDIQEIKEGKNYNFDYEPIFDDSVAIEEKEESVEGDTSPLLAVQRSCSVP